MLHVVKNFAKLLKVIQNYTGEWGVHKGLTSYPL